MTPINKKKIKENKQDKILSELIKEGKITITVNDKGEQIFSITELGKDSIKELL